MKWVYYSPELWAEVEDNEVVRSIVRSFAKRGCVKWTEVALCGANVYGECPCRWW